MKIEHQFLEEDFFIPDWKIKYLFIGTFNPKGGEKVNYFYGRESNYTWKILSQIFGLNLILNRKENFQFFLTEIKSRKIACMDIVKEVTFDENKYNKARIEGKGYKDTNLINRKVEREYNTDKILEIIRNNPNVQVFSTWGKGSSLKEWKEEIEKIPNIITLVSPSRAAKVPKGEKKFDYILNDWKSKIKL